MRSSSRVHHLSLGFTLIELLTVVAICGVLMALLFPALTSAMNSSRKSQAQSDLAALVIATKAYYADNGQYPLGPKQVELAWNTVFGDPDGLYSSADLCNALRGIPDDKNNPDNVLNPRRVVYFEGKPVRDPARPRGGIATADGQGSAGRIKKGCFVDPWGAEYVLFVDGSYRNDVSNNGGLEWFYWGGKPTVQRDLAGVCLGPDHSWGNNGNGSFIGSDDIATWQ